MMYEGKDTKRVEYELEEMPIEFLDVMQHSEVVPMHYKRDSIVER